MKNRAGLSDKRGFSFSLPSQERPRSRRYRSDDSPSFRSFSALRGQGSNPPSDRPRRAFFQESQGATRQYMRIRFRSFWR